MPEKHGRIAYFDNLKGLLIALVVAGHVISPVIATNPTANVLHHAIYLFHMPLFVFTTGLFSSSVFSGGILKVERVFSYILLALGLQLFAVIPFHSLEELLSNLFVFNSAAWYLFSCATWFLLTPLIDRMKPVPALALSVFVSLIAGGLPQLGDFLSLSRTLVFLPWFVGGRLVRPEQVLQFARDRKACLPLAAGGVVALAFYIFAHLTIEPHFYLVYGAMPYQGPLLTGVLGRIAFGITAVMISCVALALVSDKRNPLLGYLGEHTLEIFVLHRFARMALRVTGFSVVPVVATDLHGLVLLLLASVLVTGISALPIWTKPVKAITHLPWSAVLKER